MIFCRIKEFICLAYTVHVYTEFFQQVPAGAAFIRGLRGVGGGGWCGGERCECRFDVGVMMAEVWCPIDLFDFLLLHYLVRP